jgi:hypothetical protein
VSVLHHPTRDLSILYQPANNINRTDSSTSQSACRYEQFCFGFAQSATVPSTNCATSVSFGSYQNLLVDYLREIKDANE